MGSWWAAFCGATVATATSVASTQDHAHVDVTIVSPLHLQQVEWPSLSLPVEVAVRLALNTRPSGNSTTMVVRSDMHVCVDAIRDHKLVHSTCGNALALSTASSWTAQVRVALPSLAPGEYILLGRVHIPPRHADNLSAHYDLRRVVVHPPCHAKAEIRSPKNGQAVDQHFTVVPKIILSKASPLNVPNDAKVCLQVDNMLHSCISDGVFDVHVATATTIRLLLWVQSNHSPHPAICSDLIQVHVQEPATAAPSTWPRLLHRSQLVAVAPSSQTFGLSPDLARAYSVPATLSCPIVRTRIRDDQALSVAIVDSWSGDIDWNRYISTEWDELLSQASEMHPSYTRVSMEQLVAALAQNEARIDVILYFEAPTWTEWMALQRVLGSRASRHRPPRQFLFCDDLQNCRLHRRDADEYLRPFFKSVDGFIGTYAYAVTWFFRPSFLQHLDTIQWLPHSASAAFHFDALHPSPVPRVLLVGATDPRFYPLRAWAVRMAGLLPLDVHPHPGYEGFASAAEAQAQTASYARLVHSYVATFTCTSRLDFVVAKIFEIPATGSLLLLNRDVADLMERLGFVDGTHYLGYDPQDPSDAIHFAVNPLLRRRVDSIRRAGQRLVRDHHSTRHRVRDLSSMLQTSPRPAWATDGLESRAPCQVEYAGESSPTCRGIHSSILAATCCAVSFGLSE